MNKRQEVGNIAGRIILLEYSLGFICGFVPTLNLNIIRSVTAYVLHFSKEKINERKSSSMIQKLNYGHRLLFKLRIWKTFYQNIAKSRAFGYC